MEAHALALFAAEFSEKFGAPQVLDVEHSIQAHRPSLSGTISPTSYYVRPPDGMSADGLIQAFEATPGFEQMRLTLTSILGVDTYHQPLISVDDFAKKYFADNLQRIIRVVGKSNPAIEAMSAFVEGLKRPFSPSEFPHHGEFMVSGYRAPTPGGSGHVKLLYKPADPTSLMRIEREVKLHLSEINMGREIEVSRHFTREQPPELILSTHAALPKGIAYFEALADSLPHASAEQVADALFVAEKTPTRASDDVPKIRAHFGMAQGAKVALSHDDLMKKVIDSLAAILRNSGFGGGLEIKVVMGGAGIDIEFPRSARTLWLGSSFDEHKDIQAVKGACIGVRSDPALREGWDLHYRFDRKAGRLQLRAVAPGTKPADGARGIG